MAERPGTVSDTRGPGGAVGGAAVLTAEERSIAQTIEGLMESTEILTKRVELEKRKAAELDKKISISGAKLETSRAKLRGLVTDLSDGGLRVKTKQLNLAEHKLEVNTNRLNVQQKDNELVKRQIESLRRDKLQRQRVMQRLQRENAEWQAAAEKAQTEAAATQATKDRIEKEIAAIQATMMREESQYEQEYEGRIAEFEKSLEQRKKAAAEEQAILGTMGAARQNAPAVAGTEALMNILGESAGAFAAYQGSSVGLLAETGRSTGGGGGGAGAGASGASGDAASGGTGGKGGASGAGAGTAGTAGGLNARAAAAAAAAAAAQEAIETQAGDLSVEEEIELKHRSSKILWEIAKREVEVKTQSAKLAVLEDAFAKIRALTSITSVEEMVGAFLQAEEKEFSLLGMINDTNREIEKEEIANTALRAAVEKAREKGDKGAKSRKALQDSWEARLKALSAKEGRYNARYESALRTLDSIRPGVQALLNKLGSSGSGPLAALSASPGPVEHGEDLTLPSFIPPPPSSTGTVTASHFVSGGAGAVAGEGSGVSAATAAAAAQAAASSGTSGGAAGAVVTDSNVVYCLASVERRVTDLMSLYDLSLQGIPLTLPIEEGELVTALQSVEDAGHSLTSNLGLLPSIGVGLAASADTGTAAQRRAARRAARKAARAAAEGKSGGGGGGEGDGADEKDEEEEDDEDDDYDDFSPLEGISTPLPHLQGKRASATTGFAPPGVFPSIPGSSASSAVSASSGLNSSRSSGGKAAEGKRASTASSTVVGLRAMPPLDTPPIGGARRSSIGGVIPPSVTDIADDDEGGDLLLFAGESSLAGSSGGGRPGAASAGPVPAGRRRLSSTFGGPGAGGSRGAHKTPLIEESSLVEDSLFLTSTMIEGKDGRNEGSGGKGTGAVAAVAARRRIPSAPAATSGGGGSSGPKRGPVTRSPLK